MQQLVEKNNIKKTTQIFKLDEDVRDSGVERGHACYVCQYVLSDATLETIDTLHELVQSVSDETRMSLIHIAGNLTRSDEYSDEELFNLDM